MGKNNPIASILPYGHKIYQTALIYIPNGQKIIRRVPLQGPPKMYPNWNFWFENTYTIWQPLLIHIFWLNIYKTLTQNAIDTKSLYPNKVSTSFDIFQFSLRFYE
jgi:hypothetical protein